MPGSLSLPQSLDCQVSAANRPPRQRGKRGCVRASMRAREDACARAAICWAGSPADGLCSAAARALSESARRAAEIGEGRKGGGGGGSGEKTQDVSEAHWQRLIRMGQAETSALLRADALRLAPCERESAWPRDRRAARVMRARRGPGARLSGTCSEGFDSAISAAALPSAGRGGRPGRGALTARDDSFAGPGDPIPPRPSDHQFLRSSIDSPNAVRLWWG